MKHMTVFERLCGLTSPVKPVAPLVFVPRCAAPLWPERQMKAASLKSTPTGRMLFSMANTSPHEAQCAARQAPKTPSAAGLHSKRV